MSEKLSDELNQIVLGTADYIEHLPDKTNITLYEAIKVVFPEQLNQLDLLNYNLLNAIEEAVAKTDIVLDFSAHDGKAEGLPFNMNFIVRQKRLQKVQIMSDLLCYGPMPEPEDPVEQRLTISCTGQYWFSEYLFGTGWPERLLLGRKESHSIGRVKAAELLSLIADYMEIGIDPPFATDIGSWTMTATFPDGTNEELYGAMCGGIAVGDCDLTDRIREVLQIEDLRVFGGGSEEDCDDI